MTREFLLNALSNVMVKSGYALSEAQASLAKSSTSELHEHFYRALRARTILPDGSLPPGSAPAPVEATPKVTQEDIEREKLRHQEELREIRLRGQAERIADHELFKLQKQESERPQREAQLRRDREMFLAAYQTLRSFGNTAANFTLLREVLGQLTLFGIRNAIQANAVQLSPPTQAELETWQAEDVEAHNQRLLSATPTELRQAVKSEAEQRRAQTALEAQKQADFAHQARDEARKYPALPNERNGKPLDASFIKRADRTELRFLIQRYGETAVTNRLRGIDSAQPKGE
jgi:hypothetical protein